MKYDVIITSRAEQEAQATYEWWATNRSADQASRWYQEFLSESQSLATSPERCALAAENPRFPYEIRQLNFGTGSKPTHRLVFAIRLTDVVILRVRHLAHDDITLG
jgi:plasmid stabilization system protein ParE